MPSRIPVSIRAHASKDAVSCRLSALGCLLSAVCCLLLGGCNAGKQMQHDLYARELRLQEDEIYRLEDCIEEYQAIIKQLRTENHGLRQGVPAKAPSQTKAAPIDDEAGEGGERSVLDNFDWSPERPDPPPRGVDPTGDSTGDSPTDDSPSIELPTIELGEPSGTPPAIETPEPAPAPAFESAPDASPEAIETPPAIELPPVGPADTTPPTDEAPPFEPLPLSRVEPSSARLVELASVEPALLDAPMVEEAVIVAARGPSEPTGEPTIIALVRPLDESGAVGLFQGEAALMLRDPDATDGPAVLARWDYTLTEVASSWRGMETDPALDFALILPADAPRDRPLELWLRLVDGEGRKTLAAVEIVLDELKAEPVTQSDTPLVLSKSGPEATEAGAETTGWLSRPTATPVAMQADWRSPNDASQAEASEIRVTDYEEPAPQP